MRGPIQSASHALSYLINTTARGRSNYDPCLIEGEIKVKREAKYLAQGHIDSEVGIKPRAATEQCAKPQSSCLGSAIYTCAL